MMLAKFAGADLLKIKAFWNKDYDKFLPMASPAKFSFVGHIILYMWSYAQSLVFIAFLWEKLSFL